MMNASLDLRPDPGEEEASGCARAGKDRARRGEQNDARA